MRKRKLLILTPRFPYPPFSGGEKWAANLAESAAGDFDVYLFSFHGANPVADSALAMKKESEGISKIFLFRKPGKRDGALPLLPSLYFSPAAAEKIGEAASRIKPDIAHFLFSETACYAPFVTAKALIYTEIDSSYLSPSKYFLREISGIKGALNIRERIKYLKYARRFYPLFDAATAVSRRDMLRIRKFLKTEITETTPNAVSLKEFSSLPRINRKKQILFLGHYPHYPNEDAAIRLATEIFPKIREKSDYTLCLAGSAPTAKIRKLASKTIKVPGTLPDIKPFLAESSIFIAPTKYGMGVKGKILEAFAAGLPVIASPNAAQNIEGAEHGKNILIAEKKSDYAKFALLLSENGELASRLAGNAEVLVRRKYSFEQVYEKIKKIYLHFS